jgi:hypothetical protein
VTVAVPVDVGYVYVPQGGDDAPVKVSSCTPNVSVTTPFAVLEIVFPLVSVMVPAERLITVPFGLVTDPPIPARTVITHPEPSVNVAV